MDDESKTDATTDDEVEEAREIFKLCAEREEDNRQAFRENIKFGRLGGKHQWPAEIHDARTKAGLPCLTINRMKPIIHQVINETRQNKPGITVRPVDSGADRWTGQIYTGLIRNIENISGADAAYDTAVDNSASGNIGYLRAVIDWAHDDSFDKDILIKSVPNVETVYGDPFSFAPDSSDWNDAFVVEQLPNRVFKKKYPKADKINWDADHCQAIGSPWFETEQTLVAEWWHRDEIEKLILLLSNGWVVDSKIYEREKEVYEAVGAVVEQERKAKSWKVTQKIMTGAEVLEENPWPGKYIPIIPVFGETVVSEGKRILRSIIEDSKDPQMNFNFWRSKASETASSAVRTPFIGEERAFAGEDSEKWKTVNRVNHPYISVPDGAPLPQRQNYGGPSPAELQEAGSASDDIKATSSMYDASLGQRSNETSGRAINARKVEGETANFHFTDNLSRGIRHLGVVLVDLIPHVYTPGRTIRVLGQDGVENHVKLGKKPMPTTEGAGIDPSANPNPALPTRTPPEQEGKPDFAQMYDLGVGKYDVVVSAGPGYTTRRQEAADAMIQMVQANPALGPLIGDIIARAQDWPFSDEIEQRLKKMLPPQLQEGDDAMSPQLQAQMQQGMQLIQQLKQALVECQAKLQEAEGDNQAEVMKQQNERLSIAVDQFNAQTKRLEAQIKAGQLKIDAVMAAKPQPMMNPAAM